MPGTSPTAVIALPKGGGALQGIGEKFSPDLHTGTGNFTIPIALPPGRNGFNPMLSLVYSTGNGNGPFGLGWSLSVPGVSRKTSKGVPLYDDAKDTFILSGAEDLVRVGTPASGVVQYRPRTEGLFARILHHTEAGNNYWEVRSKDGLTSIYGTPNMVGSDPAVIADPSGDTQSRVFAWKLTRTTDPFGNRIDYTYTRDASRTDGPHHWDQLYLSQIAYVDYGDPANPNFLINVKFIYEPRPDPFSKYRSGFEIRTAQRCTRIDLFAGTDGQTPVRRYHLDYIDKQADHPEFVPLNGSSLLCRLKVEGFDGTASEWLPPLEFGYTQFQPKRQKFFVLKGSLPATSLSNSNLELVDMFGSGLPDILEMNGTVRYWRNNGGGQFAVPHQMDYAPAGVQLSDAGVQILDANGDGRPDLLVTTQAISGYYPLQFGGLWDRKSFQRYRMVPSFDLKDPQVRLVDLDGDGVTDAIRSATRLECYFNDPKEGWNRTSRVERETALADFPDVDFSDSRVKWADMTGDGLQDIVLVHDGSVEYWPSLGRGKWGKRMEMPGPRFPWGYNPKRILLGDVDGDGAADLVYVDNDRVTLWINQHGNAWSEPIIIQGTPPVSDADSIRVVDLLGNGVASVLWSKDANGVSPANFYFLDFTGGVKPYLLNQMNNHLGAQTEVEYKPSTWFYLQDQPRPETCWLTPLPFPMQVVAHVETTDAFSGGKLTTEYSYHHGYWDGVEREFRGFGRVDHRDTEVFSDGGTVPKEYFSPPTETRTWFHQGAIGDEFSDPLESDGPTTTGERRFRDEYYQEPWPGAGASAQVLSRPASNHKFLSGLPLNVRREAFRSLRGSVLRTELYALDGTARQSRPYAVTEHVYGAWLVSPPAADDPGLHVFFPFLAAERTTQWERGDDPLTVFKFTNNCDTAGKPVDYDDYGQVLSTINVAVPRGRAFQLPSSAVQPYLATRAVTKYAQRDDTKYIVDRVSEAVTNEIRNDGKRALDDFVGAVQASGGPPPDITIEIVGHTLNFYDGNAFTGLPLGALGDFGALVKSESLAFRDETLQGAYGANQPPYLTHSDPATWTGDYPLEFRNLLPDRAGYSYQPGGAGSPYQAGYYRAIDRRKYDFQNPPDPLHPARGLVNTRRDPLGHDTTIVYDGFGLLPTQVTDAVGLTTQAAYDYRMFQPDQLTDPNGNQTLYEFTLLGLLKSIAVLGKAGEVVGDAPTPPDKDPVPSTVFAYSFVDQATGVPVADSGKPVCVQTTRHVHHVQETDVPKPQRDETIQTIEYSDGFGRLLQTRTQAEGVIFDSLNPTGPIFGDAGLPADQSQPGGDAVGQQASADKLFVVVSGWQIYDNKGEVVEKYEPFFSTGWDYGKPGDAQHGQKARLYYDPRGHVIRTVNPDNSEQRVVYGVPGTVATPDLSNPEVFEPTAWEAYTYDANDNAGRTHPDSSKAYQYDWNTPSSILIDALGRTIRAIERNRELQSDGTWSAVLEYATGSEYDIRGNLLKLTDALGRDAFTHVYDLANRPLFTHSIDAGDHISVPDAANDIVEQRDSKGALILRPYDVVNRPIRLWARDASGQAVTLREKVIYGDDLTDTGMTQIQATAANLLGKPYQHYDEAGLVTFADYDFKGNLLDRTRQVVAESALLAPFSAPHPDWIITPFRVDWDAVGPGLLDSTTYKTTTSYDALNRIKTMQYPQDVSGSRKLLLPQYNRAGALESVQMNGATYVQRIAYNAKGQRILIAYGNGLMTRYAYDHQTFRLLRMRTEKYSTPAIPAPTYHPSGNPLQDFGYDYDLVGNILKLRDRTPGSGIQNTTLGTDALDRSFVYDPIYRLISVTGRECDVPPPSPPWNDTARCMDITSVRAYSEAYQYDRVGNMALWKHSSVDASSNVSVTNRQFTLAAGNNQLATLTIGSTSYKYLYDASGNLLQEDATRHFEWDQSDRMRVFRVQPVGAPPSIYTQYLYDSGGQRVMKLVRKQDGSYETTIYIDGVFERQRSLSGGNTVENNSLHVMDNKNRITIVRVGNALPGDASPAVKYQFGDHLGSANLVVDDTGAWINREEYLPYGETSFGSYARKRYRFTGKERDEESGLSYHGARYYAPWLVRWISCDVEGRGGHANLYRAFRSNPVRYIDPSGHDDVNGTPDTGTNVMGLASDNIVPDPVAGYVGGPLNCSSYSQASTPVHPPEYYAGVAFGTVQTLAPLGFLAPSPVPGSREFEMGRAAGQQATGAAMMTGGTAGEIAGAGADVTGVGAVAGVPLGVASAGVIAQGAIGVAAGGQTLAHAMSLPTDASQGNGAASNEPMQQSGRRYSSIEEASGKGNHYLRVVHLDKKGNVLDEWFETSGPGGLKGHTEYKALQRLKLNPGETVVFVGEHAPDNLPGGCHQLMDKTARESGADIVYMQLGEVRSSARFYQGGVGHIPAP